MSKHNKVISTKLDQEVFRRMIQLKNKGLSGRQVADALGIGKTTVNDLYKIYLNLGFDASQPRILFFDVETAPSFVATFNRFQANFTHDHVIQEGGWLISAAWKFLGDSNVQSSVVTHEEAVRCDDRRVVKNLTDAINQSNIVVAHFSKGFDMKVLRSRIALNNLSNHKPVKIVDTKQIASTCKFNSNKLDSLADYFGVGRKLDAGGIKSWIECCKGNLYALYKMQEYNKVDVEVLEQVYLALRRFDKNPPNLGLYYNDGFQHCPCCGSSELEVQGIYKVGTSEYNQVVCNACSYVSRQASKTGKKNILYPAKSN